MKYDHYNVVPERRQLQIIRAQQVLYGKILQGLSFSTALEIGPGYGGFAHFCRTRGIRYQAVEEHPALAERLRFQGFEILVADAGNAAHLATGQDLVFISHVIEHLPGHRAVSDLLRALLTKVRPEGHIVLLFPDVRWSGRQFYGDYTHVFPTTLRSVQCLCGDLGACCVRSGHYVGRWLRLWRPLHWAYSCLPLSLLPEAWTQTIDGRFMVNAYCIVRQRVEAVGFPYNETGHRMTEARSVMATTSEES